MLGAVKKFAVFGTLFFLLGGSSFAGEGSPSSYEEGLKDGIVLGEKFERERVREELTQLWSVIDSVMNYKLLLIEGKVPPPVVNQKVYLVKRGDGTVEIKKDVEVLPPAYFPVDEILSLKKELVGGEITVPSGYVVIASTKNLPTEKIALFKFLAQQEGFNPVYVMRGDFLFFGSYQRKADAEEAVKKLKQLGIDASFSYQEKPVSYFVPKEVPLAALIKQLANRVVEKEKRLLSVPSSSPEVGLNGVIFYLQKAIGAVDTINYGVHKDFRGELLKEDLRTILNQILAYLSDRTPYKRVVILSPEEEKETENTLSWKSEKVKPSGFQRKIQEIKRLLGE